jgi:NADH-quinone oxidoreductase subunit M
MEFLLQPLTLLTFFPILGVLVILFMNSEQKTAIRWVAMVTSLLTFGVSLWVFSMFNASNPDLQLEAKYPWIQVAGWNIYYYLAVDGLSILLVMLTAFLTPISILSTWTAVEDRVKDFMIFFLLLEVGMTGVFLAQDLFLFYIFWEFTLVPMYFLIGIWGGPRRVYAAVKFFLYTMAGSILMLLAILYLGIKTDTFNIPTMLVRLPDLYATGTITAGVQMFLFLAFTAAFAIKVPMWPLHSWLPDAHVEAPTAGSVILAGVLLKMGTYGFLRFNIPLFPNAAIQAAPWIALFATIGIIYGAAVSFAQTDMKKLVAYSSVSHLGFRHARLVRAECRRCGGRHFADGQPRLEHGRVVPSHRYDLRTDPHPRDQGLRRFVEDHPDLRHAHAHLLALLDGSAWSQWLRG